MIQENSLLIAQIMSASTLLLALFLGLVLHRHRKARRVARSSNQFFCLFDRKKERFYSLFRFLEVSPRFQGVKIRTLDHFLDCFKATERKGIELVFKTLDPQEKKKVSVTATDINGSRTYRIDIKPAGDTQEHIVVHIADITKLENEKLALRLEGKMLNSSLELIKNTLEHMPIPVWVRQNHELLYTNSCYEEITGHNPDKDFHNYNREAPWMSLPKGPQPKAMIINGQRKLFSFEEITIAGGHTLGFGLDKTAVETQNRTLNLFIKSYQNVLDSLSASVAIFDSEAKLKYFNHAYSIMFSFDEAFLSSKPHLGEVLDDLIKRRHLFEQANYAHYRQEQIERIKTITQPEESLIHTPDGRTIRSICAPNAAGGNFYIFEDVTDKLKLMHQYKTQLEVYSATLDNLYEGVAVFGSDNKLQLFNASFARIWNVDPNTILPGTHISELAEIARSYFSGAQGWEYYKSRVIDRMTDRLPKKRRIERNDGSILEFSYMPLPDGSNLMSYIDVTERDRMKQVLSERNQALKIATHIKTQFLNEISHQLRPSLTTISGYADMVCNELQSDSAGSELTHKALSLQKSTNILLSQIKNTLDLGMVEAGEIHPKKQLLVLWRILDDAITTLREDFANHNADVQQDFPKDDFLLWADPDIFKAALVEIIRSALRSIGDQPTLKLSAQVDGKAAQLKIHISSPQFIENDVTIDRIKESLSLELIRKALHLHACQIAFKNTDQDRVCIDINILSSTNTFSAQENERLPGTTDPTLKVAGL